MEKLVMMRPELCDGCQDCEKACEKLYGAKRLSIVKLEDTYFLLSCQQCEIPLCAEVCPVGAYREVNGVRVLRWEKCLGCGLCLQACPFGAVNLTPGGAVQKCDLCLGNPLSALPEGPNGPADGAVVITPLLKTTACVKACTNGALARMDAELLARERQLEFLRNQKVSKEGVTQERSYLSLIFSKPQEIER